MDGCVRGSGFPDWKCLYKSKNLHEKVLFCHGGGVRRVKFEIRSSNIRPYFKNPRLIEIRSPKTEIAYNVCGCIFVIIDYLAIQCEGAARTRRGSHRESTALRIVFSKSVSELRLLL